MRFKTYVTEAIQNEPRNIIRFLGQRMKEILSWEPMVESLNVLDTKTADEFIQESYGYDAARDFDFPRHAYLFGNVLKQLIHIPKFYSTVESTRDIANIVKWADYAKEDFEELSQWYKQQEMGEILSKDSHPVTIAPTYEDWKKYAEERIGEVDAIIVALNNIPVLFDGMERFLRVEVPKLREWVQSRQKEAFDGKYEPEREQVETLYHATSAKSILLRDGFNSDKPVDVIGLGELGGSQNKTVSFTHDLQIAREIVRSLKEAWMIANGQLKRAQVMRWIKDDGLDPAEAAHRVKYAMDKDADPESPEAVFRLYNWWLWVAKHPIRQNPVFGDGSGEKLLAYLKTVPRQEIGIVSARVDLSPGTYTYHRAEREYRVRPEAIAAVKEIS